MRPWIVAVLAAAVASASAPAATSHDALVRPGRGIGKLTLGMTPGQVRAALGRHRAVAKRRNLGFGAQYVELQWGFAEWTVGFQGRPGNLRAVMVGTSLRRERTREGLGTGSRTRDVLRVHPQATCSDWPGIGSYSSKERWVVVRQPSGTATVFALSSDEHRLPVRYFVVEVMVRRPSRGLVEQRRSCSANWRDQ